MPMVDTRMNVLEQGKEEYSDYDSELQEDDEIDDEFDIPNGPRSLSSLNYDPADPIKDDQHHKRPKSAMNLTSGIVVSSSSRRKPPRGARSTPKLTVRDIMGSEKAATQVSHVHSNHSRQSTKVGEGGSRTGAEMKRNMIRTRKTARNMRRTDIKNSLSVFLATNEEEETEDEGDLEGEESLISDEEEYKRKDQRGAASDDEKSVKSSKQRRGGKPQRSKSADGLLVMAGVSDDRPLRRKAKVDSDDRSVGSRKARHTSRRHHHRTDADEKSVGGGARRSRDQGKEEASDGEEKPKSSRRRPQSHEAEDNLSPDGGRRRRDHSSKKDTEDVVEKPRSSRRRMQVDDDDRSVGSKKSVGGRRRRHRAEQAKTLKSPESSRTKKGASDEQQERLDSLAKHLESNLMPPRKNNDQDEESEESSRFSHGKYNEPTTLLQFDPTNMNNVTVVDQKKANTTSEKIRYADGTESELHITELDGLPTFESSPGKIRKSKVAGSDASGRPPSSNALGRKTDEDKAGKPPKTKTAASPPVPMSPNGEKDVTRGVNRNQSASTPNNPRQRGITASKSGPKSLLSRMGTNLKAEAAVPSPIRTVPSPVRGHTSLNFHDSKGFFGAWKKKDKGEKKDKADADSDDDMQQSKSFFRKREPGFGHKALDDDCFSDED